MFSLSQSFLVVAINDAQIYSWIVDEFNPRKSDYHSR